MIKLRFIVEKIFILLGGLCLSALFLIMILQVFARYVLNAPLPWPEELALFLMAPLTFIGAYLAMLRGEHLNIPFLLEKAKPQVRKIMLGLGKLLICIFLFATIFDGASFIRSAGILKTAVLKIPMWVVYGSIWGCCFLMLLETLLQFFTDVFPRQKRLPPGKEGDAV